MHVFVSVQLLLFNPFQRPKLIINDYQLYNAKFSLTDLNLRVAILELLFCLVLRNPWRRNRHRVIEMLMRMVRILN